MKKYTSISVKYARENLAEILDRVTYKEEEFLVTKFGKPRAWIRPVPEMIKQLEKEKKKKIVK